MITTSTFNILIIIDTVFTLATFVFFYLYITRAKKTYADTICGIISVYISALLAVGQGAGTFKSEVLNTVVQDNGLAYFFGAWAFFMFVMTLLFFLKEYFDSQAGGV